MRGLLKLRRGVPTARLLARQRIAFSTRNNANEDVVRPYVEGEDTHFGFSQVPVNQKENHVKQVFESVASSYDVMNDFMSAGLHRSWKDYLLEKSSVESIASAVRRKEGAELKILDVAGGTGDVAFRFLQAAGCVERSKSSGIDPVQITVCDINTEMLRVGKKRALDRFGHEIIECSNALRFVEGNAQALQGVKNDVYDLYTIAFGLRNVTDVDEALCEAFRVLKPGGRFMCLEFSQVTNDSFRFLYDTYSFHVIPYMGEVVADDRDSYQYLVESIRKFSDQDTLLKRIKNAGFQHCSYTNLTGGIVALHEGWKPML